MWTTRTITAVTVAAVAAAGVAGVAVATGTDAPANDRLDSLVEEGVITEEDADAVERVWGEIRERREERRAERQAEREARVQALAEAAGVDSDVLVESLREGQTLTEIAGDNAADVEALLTTWAQERLDEARARLAEAEANLDEHVDAVMDGEGPLGLLRERWAERWERRGGPGGPGGWLGGPGMGGPADDLGSADESADATTSGDV